MGNRRRNSETLKHGRWNGKTLAASVNAHLGLVKCRVERQELCNLLRGELPGLAPVPELWGRATPPPIHAPCFPKPNPTLPSAHLEECISSVHDMELKPVSAHL